MAMRIDNPLVENIMSTDVFTLGRNDKLSIADDVMSQKRIRHLPVLDADGMLCGILTQRDLFRGALLRSLGYGQRAEQKLLDSLAVKDAMRDEVVTISPKSTLSDAANLMLSNKIGCLPVVEGERLVGIISEADFVKQFAGAKA
jgi:CBS domain-containing membrane protein